MKIIPGFPRYSATEDGRIWSHIRSKFLSPAINKEGYAYVNLFNEHGRHTKTVHRLIMYTYMWLSELQINHINGIKADNRLSNLEYCTQSGNQLHRYRVLWKLMSEETKSKIGKSHAKQVYQMSIEGRVLREWASTREASRHGFSQWAISDCCLGRRPHHKGYLWAYII